jgi:hypothetical protein
MTRIGSHQATDGGDDRLAGIATESVMHVGGASGWRGVAKCAALSPLWASFAGPVLYALSCARCRAHACYLPGSGAA